MLYTHFDGTMENVPDLPSRLGEQTVYRLAENGDAWLSQQNFTEPKCYPKCIDNVVYYVVIRNDGQHKVVACSRASTLDKVLSNASYATQPLHIRVSSGTLRSAISVLPEVAFQQSDGREQPLPDFPSHPGEKTVYPLSPDGKTWLRQKGFTFPKCYPHKTGDRVYYAVAGENGTQKAVACSLVKALESLLPGGADDPAQAIYIYAKSGTLYTARRFQATSQDAGNQPPAQGNRKPVYPTMPGCPAFPPTARKKTTYRLSDDGKRWLSTKSFTESRCYPHRMEDALYYKVLDASQGLRTIACSPVSAVNDVLLGGADNPNQLLHISVSGGTLRSAKRVLEGSFLQADGSKQDLPTFPQHPKERTVYRLSDDGKSWLSLENFTERECYPFRMEKAVYYALPSGNGKFRVFACSRADTLDSLSPGASDMPGQPIHISVSDGILKTVKIVPQKDVPQIDGGEQALPSSQGGSLSYDAALAQELEGEELQNFYNELWGMGSSTARGARRREGDDVGSERPTRILRTEEATDVSSGASSAGLTQVFTSLSTSTMHNYPYPSAADIAPQDSSSQTGPYSTGLDFLRQMDTAQGNDIVWYEARQGLKALCASRNPATQDGLERLRSELSGTEPSLAATLVGVREEVAQEQARQPYQGAPSGLARGFEWTR